MKPKIILAIALIVFSLIILAQNTQVVVYRLFFWKIAISQIILVPFAMLIGFFVGFVVAKITSGQKKRSRELSES